MSLAIYNYLAPRVIGVCIGPYSPEVNPVEHIWDELREKYFHNRVFPSLQPLIDMLCQGLNDLADDPKRLRSLTSFPHLNITI